MFIFQSHFPVYLTDLRRKVTEGKHAVVMVTGIPNADSKADVNGTSFSALVLFTSLLGCGCFFFCDYELI